MAEIILGCDKNNVSSDKKHQKTIASLLEKAGHTVKIMSVGPGALQNEMKKKTSKGKIAVFLVNGADLQTYKDAWYGMRPGGYYHTKYCYFGLQGYINQKTCTCEGAKKVKLKKAHDDHSSKSFTKDIVGMTTAEVMEKYKSRIAYACGSTVKELGENLVSVIGGGTNTSSSSSNSNQENYGSIKDALKDVLYGWDGDVECYLRDDTIHIRKIKSPDTATLELIEGKNVNLGSVSVTDVNPSTPNYVYCSFGKYDLSIKDDHLINRFGKISKKVTVPTSVKTLDKAKEFLQREWSKTKRDNGHSLECSTQGNTKWKNGWCRVYLPSFNINDYMYISKVSQDESGNGEWDCRLKLVDYPPGFGEPTTQQNKKSKSSDSKNSKTKSKSKTPEKAITDAAKKGFNSKTTTKKTIVAKKGTVKKKSIKGAST